MTNEQTRRQTDGRTDDSLSSVVIVSDLLQLFFHSVTSFRFCYFLIFVLVFVSFHAIEPNTGATVAAVYRSERRHPDVKRRKDKTCLECISVLLFSHIFYFLFHLSFFAFWRSVLNLTLVFLMSWCPCNSKHHIHLQILYSQAFVFCRASIFLFSSLVLFLCVVKFLKTRLYWNSSDSGFMT